MPREIVTWTCAPFPVWSEKEPFLLSLQVIPRVTQEAQILSGTCRAISFPDWMAAVLPGHPCLNFFAESDTPHPCRIPSVICRVPKNSNESDTRTRVGHRHPHPCPCNTGWPNTAKHLVLLVASGKWIWLHKYVPPYLTFRRIFHLVATSLVSPQLLSILQLTSVCSSFLF